MIFKKLESINSTQIYLKENIEDYISKDSNILISALHQSNGIGTNGRSWETLENAIAFSFTFHPNQILSLSSIEIGCLIHKFIVKEYNLSLRLKWPNDLINDSKKCGGIICNNTIKNMYIAGIGINISPSQNFEYGVCPIRLDDPHEFAKSFYNYYLNNRMQPSEIPNYWNQNCYNINKKVITEDGREFILKGINNKGEVIVKDNNENILNFNSIRFLV